MLRSYAIVGVAGLVVALSGAGTATAANTKSAATCAGATVDAASVDSVDTAVDAVHCLVNRERTRRGMAALRLSQTLSYSATQHSEDMADRKYFSHVSPGGATLRQRVIRAGYSPRGLVGETIAWGSADYSTPAELVRSVMTSAGHRVIVLDRRYREVGIGMAMAAPMSDIGNDSATLTLIFGRR